MTPRTIVLVVLVVAIATLSPATPSLGASVDEEGDLLLRPNAGPNGEYAFINGDGDLEIAIESPGMNVDSRLTAEAVFDIVNEADGDRRVWITDSADRIEYGVDGESIEGEANAVTIPAGGSLEVGFDADAMGRSAGQEFAETFTVNAGTVDTTTTEDGVAGGGGGGGGDVAAGGIRPIGPSVALTQVTFPSGTTGGYRVTYLDPADVRFGSEEGPLAAITVGAPESSAPDDPPVAMVGDPVTVSAEPSVVSPVTGPEAVLGAADIELVGRDDSSARIRWTIDRGSMDAVDAARLQLAYHDGSDWTPLDTSVRADDGDGTTLLVEADAPQASKSALYERADVGFAWRLSDGRTLGGEQIEIAFDEPGRYTIDLTVTDGAGRSDTARSEVIVNDQPAVRIEGPAAADADEPVTLRAVVEDDVGDRSIAWRLPGGRVATGETVTATFEPGTTAVEVVVTDEYGASGSARHAVTVEQDSTVAVGDITAPAGITVISEEGSSFLWLLLLILPLIGLHFLLKRSPH